AQVAAERRVRINAEQAVFEAVTEFEGEFFFGRGGEGDGLDLPTELLLGFFGELHAEAGGVDAATLDFRQGENPVKFLFDFGKGFVLKFDAEAVPHHVTDFLADIDDAEVLLASNIDADVEIVRYMG